MQHTDRRDFLKLAGMAGVTFTAGLFPGQQASAQAANDFHFVQISDTHWGFKGPANPDAEHTLEKAIVDGERPRPRSPTSSSSPATSPTRPRTARSAARA